VSDGLFVALAAIPAYLLGTFPTAVLVARAGGHDVLAEGSGNPGASNVARLMGWKWGLLVMAGDLAKGAIAAGVGLAVAGRGAAYVLGILAVIGHTYPVTRHFKGGKGVATAAGVLFGLDPRLGLAALAAWIVVAVLFRYSSLASLIAAIAATLCAWLLGADARVGVVVAAIAVLLVWRHRENIARLAAGTESQLGRKKANPPDPNAASR